MGEEEGFVYQRHHQLLTNDPLYPTRFLLLSIVHPRVFTYMFVCLWILVLVIICFKWLIWSSLIGALEMGFPSFRLSLGFNIEIHGQ